ncbi:MAG: cell envelope integrity protein CreD [Flavobacteriales bacterium]|nr:cell envelope integrity protein CreD [Flavobacteriales bacterium]MBP9080377.1 cell envelope integrity protein CreD [Flavobacteriales bacterium]
MSEPAATYGLPDAPMPGAPRNTRMGWLRRSMTFRAVVVAVLVLLLLIPLSMVEDLIWERENRKQEAITEVGASWGGSQVLTGPYISVPFQATVRVDLENGRSEMREVTQFAHFLPERLELNSMLEPEKRHRGIYDVVVYKGKFSLRASFPDLQHLLPSKSAALRWEEARLCLGITDLRSIKKQVSAKVGAGELAFEPGLPSDDIATSGLSVALPMDSAALGKAMDLQIALDLNGSGSFRVVPVGRTTSVQVRSTWPDPSFQGAFLPDSSTVDAKGFNAHWTVLHLNRPYPQEFTGSRNMELGESAFGADLILPVDDYQKSTRATKYGVMLIVLVFLVFFFVEVLQRLRIHPIQYLLVGFALCIFYTLLVALSEHIGFGAAYVASAVAVIALVVFYARSVFKVAKATQLLALVMLLVFGFMFTVINQEDYALLIGSIGLFIVLAVVMALSRKIDWDTSGE